MRITIDVIPHGDQRYPTCGDWIVVDENNLRIFVSEMGDWRKEMAVGLHEVVEALLCKANGVSQTAVDQFDLACPHGEPGDDPTGPYHREHCFATAVERMFIAAVGLSWSEYEGALP
jgi:hypothetical protein